MTISIENSDVIKNLKEEKQVYNVSSGKFMLKFTLIHTISYLIVGMISFSLFSYVDIFESSESFSQFMRPLDSPIVQASVLFQIGRGLLLALPFVPYRSVFIKDSSGWVKIWMFLLILTCFGAVITGPGSIEGMIYTNLPLNDHIGLGYVEVILQTLLFSFGFWKSEQKKIKN